MVDSLCESILVLTHVGVLLFSAKRDNVHGTPGNERTFVRVELGVADVLAHARRVVTAPGDTQN